MTIEEIEAALAKALPLRPPTFSDDYHPNVKIAALEDYMLQAAWHAAELEEALHWLVKLVEHFRKQVEEMTGYEVALPTGKRAERITKEDVLSAKRQLNPVVFDAGGHARMLRDSIRRQIDRFDREEKIISRAYTLISGG